MTVWVCGTSVSLTGGGYLDQLRERLTPSVQVRNLSIGDQDSVMGYVRLLQHQAELRPGDTLIWEYSLLDILLNGFFGIEDALFAMTSAWRMAQRASVRPIVVMTTPRDDIGAPSPVETRIQRAVDASGLPHLSFRQILRDVGAANPAEHYQDDRHPHNDSPGVGRLVERLLALIDSYPEVRAAEAEASGPRWVWHDARRLAQAGAGELVTWKNSLLTVEALRLSPDNVKVLLPSADVVRLGVVSTQQSGSLWCGHSLCNPASLRMPADISLPFMLRLTRLPCARAVYGTIEAAPPHAFSNGVWADYGQLKTTESLFADVFGLLARSWAAG